MEAETVWDWLRLYMLGWEPVHHWCHSTTSRCRPLRQLRGSVRDRWGPAPALSRSTYRWDFICGFSGKTKYAAGAQICKLRVPVWRKLWVRWGWHDDYQDCEPFLSHQSNSRGRSELPLENTGLFGFASGGWNSLLLNRSRFRALSSEEEHCCWNIWFQCL